MNRTMRDSVASRDANTTGYISKSRSSQDLYRAKLMDNIRRFKIRRQNASMVTTSEGSKRMMTQGSFLVHDGALISQGKTP